MNCRITQHCVVRTVLLTGALACAAIAHAEQADSYQWLEAVEGSNALEWVTQQNKQTINVLEAQPEFQPIYESTLEILNDKTRIPYAATKGEYLYNFWRDQQHVRGIYRRTTMDEYKKPNPKWETILDVDALAKQEGENWVYKGMNCLKPAYQRCLVSLSRGGADATVVREFDIARKAFVEGGYRLPEAKSRVDWIDINHVFVGTNFGEGSLTDSGYPAIVKVWSRGTALDTAKQIFAADSASVAANGYTAYDGDTQYQFVTEATSFYTTDVYHYDQGKLNKLPIPANAELAGIKADQLFITLKSEWKGFAQGEIIYADFNHVMAGNAQFKSFIKPDMHSSVSGLSFTLDGVLVTVQEDVKDKLYLYQIDKKGAWQKTRVAFPDNGNISVFDVDDQRSDFFVDYTSFLEPSTLYHVENGQRQRIKAAPSHFDASKFISEQFFATSKDGTRVPYFVVRAKDLKFDGSNPTLLYGYGGFEVSLMPSYSAITGRNWLEMGGVYVLANIRGGGEYGPRWHQAALKKNRHKAYEDFEAIAEDLIKRNITSSKHLGIRGGSNGGLLMGAAFTRRPDLYKAVVCQVPLLDMKRFNKLLAGASWMGEYGNPDVADEWEYIKTYSPYHNLKADVAYPQVLFMTSTRDDRVHPGHARKMVAKMKGMGHEVYYFENTEGGHAGAANNEQRAKMYGYVFSYLFKLLK